MTSVSSRADSQSRTKEEAKHSIIRRTSAIKPNEEEKDEFRTLSNDEGTVKSPKSTPLDTFKDIRKGLKEKRTEL